VTYCVEVFFLSLIFFFAQRHVLFRSCIGLRLEDFWS
jgi:hypothetical protein